MKLALTLILAAIAVLSVSSCKPSRSTGALPDFQDLAHLRYPAPRPGTDDVSETLRKLEDALALLEREASEDATLMELVRRYRAGAKSAETLRAELAGLSGLNVDVYGMVHDGFGASPMYVMACQMAAADFAATYQCFWTEDHTGGEFMTSRAATDEMLHELTVDPLNPTGLPLSRDEVSRIYVQTSNMYASHMLIGTTVMVYGGDYRPLKAIQQRLLSYADLYEASRPLPSDLKPEAFAVIRDALTDARDLYLLSYVAAKKASDRQVIVFGVSHLPHLARLLGDYGARGQAYAPREFAVEDERIVAAAARLGVQFE